MVDKILKLRHWDMAVLPVKVLDHDVPLPEFGKAAPYGVYDIEANEGYVSVGISADMAQFAVNTICSWGLKRIVFEGKTIVEAVV